jgi:hypothetical protein
VKLSSYIYLCYKFLFTSSYINLFLSLKSPKFYEALTSIGTLKNSVFLLSCFGKVHLNIYFLHIVKPLGISNRCDL